MPEGQGAEPPDHSGRRPGRRRWLPVLLASLVVLAIVAAAAGAAGLGGARTPDASTNAAAVTAKIARTTMVETLTASGDLGFGVASPVKSAAPGTVTWLPEAGTVLARGKPLLRADELPVVLLFGALPMYRPLALNVKGNDVRQFKENLRALGYSGFTVDDTFSAATVTATKRWQKALGVTQTGSVEAHQVIYAAGPLRVEQRVARVGDQAAGEVLTVTGTDRMVSLAIAVKEAGWAVVGVAVTVGLPDGREVAATVTVVGTEGTAANTGENSQEQSSDRAGSGTSATTVAVQIGVPNQEELGTYQKGPVSVRYVGRARKDVLTVPVAALLALAEGGYGLEIVDGSTRRLVAVTVGLFANGQVEVAGADLREGMTMRMPG